MTKEDAIKFLQQLYPNGGHCWLDEQRIEAIGMAIRALQEESLSEELETELANKKTMKEITIQVPDGMKAEWNKDRLLQLVKVKKEIVSNQVTQHHL